MSNTLDDALFHIYHVQTRFSFTFLLILLFLWRHKFNILMDDMYNMYYKFIKSIKSLTFIKNENIINPKKEISYNAFKGARCQINVQTKTNSNKMYFPVKTKSFLLN